MGIAERVYEVVRTLPMSDMGEVLDFAEFIRAKHRNISQEAPSDAIAQPVKLIDRGLMAESRTLAPKGVSWQRDELYDRDVR